MSQQPGWWQQLMSPCPATLPAPHTLPCPGGQQGGSGGTCPAPGDPASRTSDSQHGGFAALPSLGKMVSLCPPCPLKPRAGQQALSYVSCRVALQIGRVGTALRLPVPPYLAAGTLPWGSLAAGRAVALGGLLWHLGVPTAAVVPAWGTIGPLLPLWGTRPQGRAALEC